MREVTISDRELQALIAPALISWLKAKGFQGGLPSGEHNGFWFPISLDFAGEVHAVRYEDGTWIFSQELNERLIQRTHSAREDFARVLVSTAMALKGAG